MEDALTSWLVPPQATSAFRSTTLKESANEILLNITIPLFGSLLAPATIPIDFNTWPHILYPICPILVMAMLVQRANTSLLRLMLFPIVVLLAFRTAFVYRWTNPDYASYNALKGYTCTVIAAKAIDYAFFANGIQRCRKVIKEVVAAAEEYELGADGITTGPTDPRLSPPKWKYFNFVLSPISEAFALMCSCRGIGYDHGEGVFIPPEFRPLKKWSFVHATLQRCIVRFLLADLIDTTWKMMSPLDSPDGGSIFIQALSWKYRYILSTLYHVSTGLMVICGFEISYELMSIFAIIILDQAPTDWPPIFYKPFNPDSLHEFWAVRWHQLFRRVFFVFGGLPGYWLSGRLGFSKGRGLLIGTFAASGLFHELPLYALGRGFDYRLPLFFVLQALFMLGERHWKRMTGRPVRGWSGRLWVVFVIIVVGQSTFTNPIHERGLAGAMIIPQFISPIRCIFIPGTEAVLKSLSPYITQSQK